MSPTVLQRTVINAMLSAVSTHQLVITTFQSTHPGHLQAETKQPKAYPAKGLAKMEYGR